MMNLKDSGSDHSQTRASSVMTPERKSPFKRDFEERYQRWLPWATEKLSVLQDYGQNWDGYGAEAPNPKTVEAAIFLLANFKTIFNVSGPEVNPTRVGGACLEWEQGCKYLAIEIESSSADGWSFLYKDASANARRSGQIVVGDQFKDSFVQSLKLMFP